ncbi:hypothetical protein [Pseudoxanthomonas composti]|uniref:Uncharacterized protein n=1 Tax=Pseudoxanthomonas composti TaxID=2137479 RepID=A0A4V1N0X2_9GAMM|nr:hypothetical protein [Pseudoxanthomonas composti]RXR03539.1 hypothetical protein EPA99_14020 [Pseudoxanthomonas composti]
MDQGFVWTPGVGIDQVALARLRLHFRKPQQPMGEAWFMSEQRKMFPELQGELGNMSIWDLQIALGEIASGTSSFGPFEEWREWYHYLLAQLVPRGHDAFVYSLVELLITCFMTQYPNGIHRQPYPGFGEDVLATLGRCVMEPQCWSADQIVVGTFLHRSNNNPARTWRWYDASGDLSASLFLCIKYLPAPAVTTWFRSVLEISSPHWRAQLIAWLVGANELLTGAKTWPSELKTEAYPNVGWEWSHCLGPGLAIADDSGSPVLTMWLPEDACRRVVDEVRNYFTDDTFLLWLESISSVDYLEEELEQIPVSFERLYLKKDGGG